MRGEFVIDPTGTTPLSFRSWEALVAAHGNVIDGDTTIRFVSAPPPYAPSPFGDSLLVALAPQPPSPSIGPLNQPRVPAHNRRERRAQAALARRRGA